MIWKAPNLRRFGGNAAQEQIWVKSWLSQANISFSYKHKVKPWLGNIGVFLETVTHISPYNNRISFHIHARQRTAALMSCWCETIQFTKLMRKANASR